MNVIKHSDYFAKQLRKHGDQGTIRRLLKAIQELEGNPLLGEELSATPELLGLRSLRCGDWRVAYEVKEGENETVIMIVAFGHGHWVYEELPRHIQAAKKSMV